ncbi:hypothetical protein RhiirB3_518319 [Rhizophagus irregularis]|nr:hypothetical protein RhiirB3_518319 [Rhizophagus irregularis]
MTVCDSGTANPSELEILRQRNAELGAKISRLEEKNFELEEERRLSSNYLMKQMIELRNERALLHTENFDLKFEITKLRGSHYIDELKKELESKKNRKFQTRCIQIAKILNEEPIIEYRPSFMQGLELDAFFQKYRIALEVQGAHSTRWYKDIKKLEDIVNHDRKKRCICLDNGIFLIEVWYDQTGNRYSRKDTKN